MQQTDVTEQERQTRTINTCPLEEAVRGFCDPITHLDHQIDLENHKTMDQNPQYSPNWKKSHMKERISVAMVVGDAGAKFFSGGGEEEEETMIQRELGLPTSEPIFFLVRAVNYFDWASVARIITILPPSKLLLENGNLKQSINWPKKEKQSIKQKLG